MKQQAQGHILITAGNVTPYDAMQINEWTYPKQYVCFLHGQTESRNMKKKLSNKAVPTIQLYITESV